VHGRQKRRRPDAHHHRNDHHRDRRNRLRRPGRALALVATMVLLSGCRVLTFPVAAPDTMGMTSSSVTITNTTPHQVFVRFQAYCGDIGPWGFRVRDVDYGLRLAQACPSPTGSFPLNGTLVDVPSPDSPVVPAVLQPGQSITVVGEAFGAGVTEISGRSVPFDAYAEWCFDGCVDIAKLTP